MAIIIHLLVYSIGSGQVIQITTSIQPPYPVRYSDINENPEIVSQIAVVIENTTMQPQDFILSLRIKNLNTGLLAQTDDINFGICKNIGPGERLDLSGNDLDEYFNFKEASIDGQKAYTLPINKQDFPEGMYEFCITAISCQDRITPLSESMLGCSLFEVKYADAPTLIDVCNKEISLEENPALIINWQHDIQELIDGYEVTIIEVIDGFLPEDLMQFPMSSPFFFQETTNDKFILLNIPDQLDLKPGKKYAIQIRAIDLQEQVRFRNEGKSEVCTFQTLAGAGDDIQEAGDFIPHYPLSGEYIPFNFFPVAIQFQPYSDNYRYHEFEFSLTENQYNLTSGSFQASGTPAINNDDNRWAKGPAKAQQNIISKSCGIKIDPFEENRASILAYNPPKEEMQQNYGHSYFVNGARYDVTYHAEIKNDQDDLNPVLAETLDYDYYIGMDKPVLNAPFDNDTLEAGKIEFKFKPSEHVPSKLFPDYYIFRADGQGECDEYNGSLYQKGVLQIRSDDTGELIFQKAWTVGDEDGINSNYHLNYFFDDQGNPLTDRMEVLKNELYPAEKLFADSITKPGSYSWNVGWVDHEEGASFVFYQISDTFKFYIRDPSEKTTPSPGEKSRCSDICEIDLPEDKTEVPFAIGDTLRIGLFSMKVTQKVGKNGEGNIEVPWINHIKVKVRFEGVEANAKKQVFAGVARAVLEDDLNLKTTVGGFALDFKDIPSQRLRNAITASKRVSDLINGDEITLPVALDQKIDGEEYLVGLMDMEFKPGKANLQAVMSLDLPFDGEFFDQILSFGSQICFGPNGYEYDFVLFRVGDLELTGEGGYDITIKGATGKESIGQLDTSGITYVDWDCDGFRKASIAGEVVIPRNKLVPIGSDGQVIPGSDNKVKGVFRASWIKSHGFIARMHMDSRFAHPSRTDLSFEAKEVLWDVSDAENPPEIRFPQGYQHPALASPSTAAAWRGFYFKDIVVHLDSLFDLPGETEIALSNFIADYGGISVDLDARNLLPWENGAGKDGWGISMDTLRASWMNGDFKGLKVMGKLGMPILDEKDNFKYRAIADIGESSKGFSVAIFADGPLSIPISLAEITVDDNSRIQYVSKEVHPFQASIHGSMKITNETANSFLEDAGNSIPSMNFDEVRFSYFKNWGSANKTDFDVSLASPQKYMGGFPVTLDSVGLTTEGLNPAFIIVPQLNLVSGVDGFKAKTKLVVTGELEGLVRQHIKVKDVKLAAIGIDATWSGVGLKGELEFYNENNAEGFRANALEVLFPLLSAPVKLNAEFGTFGSANKATANFGSDQYFGYWYVDGMLPLPDPGIGIFPGFSLYGIGGGAYYNMSFSGLPTYKDSGNAQAQPSGAKYAPEHGSYGIKLATIMGTSGNPEALNMDVALQLEFNASFGINNIALLGDAYVMTPLKKREKAKIHGNLVAQYDFPNRVLDCNLDIFARIEESGAKIYGGFANDKVVNAKLYAGGPEDIWFLNIGTAEERGLLKAEFGGGLGKVDLNSYLMVGDRVPSVIPEPPKELMDILNGGANTQGDHGEIMGSTTYSTQSRSNLSIYSNANGFAFGAGLHVNPDPFEFLILFVKMEAWLGFDFTVSKSSEPIHCSNLGGERGANGWYGQGQLYAGLKGSMGIHVDLFGWDKRVSFLDFAAALRIYGGTPSPTFFAGNARVRYNVLDGLIKGSSSFAFTIGDPCIPASGGALAGVSVIGDTYPNASNNSGVSPVADFAVTYNLPVRRNIEIPEFDDDGKPLGTAIYRFNPVYTILNKQTNKLLAVESTSYNGTMDQVTLVLSEPLQPQTNYSFTVKVTATHRGKSGDEQVLVNGQIWHETVTVLFKTGDLPETMEYDQMVKLSYPYRGQRYFLKEETENGLGFIWFKNDISSSYLYQVHPENKLRYNYFMRFSDNKNGEPIEIPYDPASFGSNHALYFPVSQLENNRLYRLELIRRLNPDDRFRAVSLNSWTSQYAVATNSTKQQGSFEHDNIQYDYEAEIRNKTIVNPDQRGVDPRKDKTIFTYIFGVSAYDRFEDKVPDGQWSGTNYKTSELVYQIIPEKIDYVDKYGIYYNNSRTKPITFWFNLQSTTSSRPVVATPEPVTRSIAFPKLYSRISYYQNYAKKYSIQNNLSTWLLDFQLPRYFSGFPTGPNSNDFHRRTIFNRSSVASTVKENELGGVGTSGLNYKYQNLALNPGTAAVATTSGSSPAGITLMFSYYPTDYYYSLSRMVQQKAIEVLSKRFLNQNYGYWMELKDPVLYQKMLSQTLFGVPDFYLLNNRKYEFGIGYSHPVIARGLSWRTNWIKGWFEVPVTAIID